MNLDRFRQVLVNHGFPQEQINTFIDDLASYGDDEDYENISDSEIVEDFKEFFGV